MAAPIAKGVLAETPELTKWRCWYAQEVSHLGLANQAPEPDEDGRITGEPRYMLDMLAAVARKDYEDRRRRVAQGIAKAKLIDGKYTGRPADEKRNKDILGMLEKRHTWSEVCRITGASRSTLSRLVKASREAQATATN